MAPTPAAAMITRGPQRSTTYPAAGEMSPLAMVPAVMAPAVVVRLQPRSSVSGFSMTPMKSCPEDAATKADAMVTPRMSQP